MVLEPAPALTRPQRSNGSLRTARNWSPDLSHDAFLMLAHKICAAAREGGLVRLEQSARRFLHALTAHLRGAGEALGCVGRRASLSHPMARFGSPTTATVLCDISVRTERARPRFGSLVCNGRSSSPCMRTTGSSLPARHSTTCTCQERA